MPPQVEVKPAEQHDKMTGFCSDGNHEQAEKAPARLSKKGEMFTACRGEYQIARVGRIVCDCWCHEMFRLARRMKADLLAAAEGAALPLVMPGTAASVAPSPVEMAQPATIPAPRTAPILLPAAPTVNPTRRIYRELFSDPNLTEFLERFILKHTELVDVKVPRNTVNGRRERGSLDVNVETVCRLWVDGKFFGDMTPQAISLYIDPTSPPSPGAVRACLIRFSEKGFVEIQDSPVKFLAFKGRALERAIISIVPSKWSS